ncbi:hypothetical protein LIER_29513 [Lithospermum erythrorhizon]|uniref:Uncharacterized protein n=1 Tax=Lithospermum erythrorhizon TaxID=34254 RepID=A0AAV3RJG5_LITER
MVVSARTSFLTGDEKLTYRILKDYVLCTESKDGRVTTASMFLLHYLKSMTTRIKLPAVIGAIMHEAISLAKFNVLPFGMVVRWPLMRMPLTSWQPLSQILLHLPDHRVRYQLHMRTFMVFVRVSGCYIRDRLISSTIRLVSFSFLRRRFPPFPDDNEFENWFAFTSGTSGPAYGDQSMGGDDHIGGS